METTSTYSTQQACRATGATYRQLDYWMRLEILECVSAGGTMPGNGYARRMDGREIRVLAVVVRLARLGAKTDALAVTARELRAVEEWATEGWLFVRHDGRLTAWPETAGWFVDLGTLGLEDEVAA